MNNSHPDFQRPQPYRGGDSEDRGSEQKVSARDEAGPTFADWLDEHMRRKNLSISGLARALGVSNATVSTWRAGRREPVPSTMRQLASLFGVAPDEPMNLTKWRSKP